MFGSAVLDSSRSARPSSAPAGPARRQSVQFSTALASDELTCGSANFVCVPCVLIVIVFVCVFSDHVHRVVRASRSSVCSPGECDQFVFCFVGEGADQSEAGRAAAAPPSVCLSVVVLHRLLGGLLCCATLRCGTVFNVRSDEGYFRARI